MLEANCACQAAALGCDAASSETAEGGMEHTVIITVSMDGHMGNILQICKILLKKWARVAACRGVSPDVWKPSDACRGVWRRGPVLEPFGHRFELHLTACQHDKGGASL